MSRAMQQQQTNNIQERREPARELNFEKFRDLAAKSNEGPSWQAVLTVRIFKALR